MSTLELINKEINTELANEAAKRMLLATTFKGLNELKMRQALMEGMALGLTFNDFLVKNVYAIPFKDGYSLIMSINYARKIAQKNGVWTGKSELTYDKDGKLESCAITAKKRIGEDIAEYTALVFFKEFNTGRNQWIKMPAMMLQKVAEMHALRKACPEDLSQLYVEEELEKTKFESEPIIDVETIEQQIKSAKTIDDLKEIYRKMNGNDRNNDEIKASYERKMQDFTSEAPQA